MRLPLACLVAGFLAIPPATAQADSDVTLFAAASLKDALEAILTDFEADTGYRVTLSLAGSSALARQIQFGAPADLFLSANTAWMDALEAEGLLEPDTRRDLLTNRLVLIGPTTAPPVDLFVPGALSRALGEGPLAMGLVEAVPAGIYGKQALIALGHWTDIADRVAQTDNVRAALALVANGAAPMGLVYASDVQADPRVAVLAAVPPDSHTQIRYPLADVIGRDTPAENALWQHLQSAQARDAFSHHGFAPFAAKTQ